MSTFRMTGSADGELATDETFAEALKARFGLDDSVEDPGGGDGNPPLASPSPETPEDDPGSADGEGGAPSDLPLEPAGQPENIPDGDPAPGPAPAPAPAPEDYDLNVLFERYYGAKPTPQQMTSLLGFVDQVQNLSPQQQAALNEVMAGRIPQTPDAQAGLQPSAPAKTQVPPANIPQFDDLTDEARAVIEPLYRSQQDVLQRLQASETELARRQLQQEEDFIVAGVQTAANQFVDEYGAALDATDLMLLETKAQQSGQFPFFMQQNNGDPARAYRALIDMVAYSDPILRQKMAQAAETGQSAPAAETPADSVRKSRAAAAVSAGGVSGNKVSPLNSAEPSAPRTPAEAREWAINEISAATGMPRVS